MACVELPKDAYGRSIPLDTGTLYKKNGAAVFIYHYDYDPRDKAWYVETDDGSRSVSELLLDRDDSWEKLLADLIDRPVYRPVIPNAMDGYVFCPQCGAPIGEYGVPNYCHGCGVAIRNGH